MTAPDISTLAPVLDSPALRAHLEARVTEFIDAVFDEALTALEDGDMATRAQFVKMILPSLLKVQKKQDEEGVDVEKVREETREMFEAMGKALRGDDGS